MQEENHKNIKVEFNDESKDITFSIEALKSVSSITIRFNKESGRVEARSNNQQDWFKGAEAIITEYGDVDQDYRQSYNTSAFSQIAGALREKENNISNSSTHESLYVEINKFSNAGVDSFGQQTVVDRFGKGRQKNGPSS